MNFSVDETIKTIEICIKLAEQQKNKNSESSQSYLNGYIDACKLILEQIKKQMEG